MCASAAEFDRPAPRSVDELEELLSRPPERLIQLLGELEGDILLLGVGGKMGPTMARMAKRASDAAGVRRRVIGVSRFTSNQTRRQLEGWGVETLACDLLEETALENLPDAPHVVYLAGFKFGAQSTPATTWAVNCYLPALISRKFRHSRIVALSTGNVYGMVPVASGGSRENDPPRPEGEYAMSALGRERMFEYFSRRDDIPLVLLRLNYATELRYGVLVDLAQQVQAGAPVDISMGHVNVIWLGDANAMTLAALAHAQHPARVLNLAGAEILSLRDVCQQLGRLLEKPLHLTGQESATAFLNNGQPAYQYLGTPQVPAAQMIRWTAEWLRHGGEVLGKPTHFQVRDGNF